MASFSPTSKSVLLALASFGLGIASAAAYFTVARPATVEKVAGKATPIQIVAPQPTPTPQPESPPPPPPGDEGPPDEHPSGTREANRNNFRQMWRDRMNNPAFAKAMAIQQRAALDGQYASLFKKLALSPEDLAKFKSLLVEKQATLRDVMMSARAQGMDPRSNPEAFKQLLAEASTEVDAGIQALLSPEQLSAYQNYVATLPEQNLINQVNQRLSYTGTILSDTQAQALSDILLSTTQNSLSTLNPRNLERTATLTDSALQQASSFLTADQLAALKQIQEEQAAAQTLRRPPRPTP